jgi:hypothetical protein
MLVYVPHTEAQYTSLLCVIFPTTSIKRSDVQKLIFIQLLLGVDMPKSLHMDGLFVAERA